MTNPIVELCAAELQESEWWQHVPACYRKALLNSILTIPESEIAAVAGDPIQSKFWQHEETGRMCNSLDKPGPRWIEVMFKGNPSPAAPVAPEGMKLVPQHPTSDQMQAGRDEWLTIKEQPDIMSIEMKCLRIYKAMLAACGEPGI